MTRPERVRAFLALNLPIMVVRRIGDEVRAVQAGVAATGLKVAWVPPANLHLTLKFLGSLPLPSVEAIRGRLGRELAARPGFELEARGLGAFPDLARPRVLWAGVKPRPELAALQRDVDRWCEELGFPREERAFHPHLTVGRVKDGAASLEAVLAERAGIVFGAGRVTEVVLYESRTSQKGSEYLALGRIPMATKSRREERDGAGRDRERDRERDGDEIK